MKHIIEASHVEFKYGDEQDNILDGIDLHVERGQFVAIIGANGSGKTTLAKHFNAILLPLQGTVLVDGMDTADEKVLYDVRRTVGMVFQNPDNQIVASVVEEDVAFALENLGVERSEIRSRIEEAMETTGIAKYRKSSPHKLSGGQKQRVAIAGVLAMSPECIVLDEPTAMLDPVGRARVIRTILSLNRDRGITIVLITHFMEDAALADRILVLSRGSLVKDGIPREVFGDAPLLRSLDLDVPIVTELCSRLREEGYDLPETVTGVDECVDLIESLFAQAGEVGR